jgi:hypothetical protein
VDNIPVRDGKRAEELEDGDATGTLVKKPKAEHFRIESRGHRQEGIEEHKHVLRDWEDFHRIRIERHQTVEHRACAEPLAGGVGGEGDC